MGFSKLALALVVSFTVYPGLAVAEYRAFLIQIKSKEGELIREFRSTLDPEQYVGYFPIPLEQKISYVETWMCFGPTPHQQPICDNPKASKPSNEPDQPKDSTQGS